MYTPWGAAQSTEVIGPGILWASTASHGGIHLDEEKNAEIPAYMRTHDGWYEEDVDWAIVATVFPQHFNEEQRARAAKTLKNWVPMAYETFYGVVISPGESRAKDAIAFRALHKNEYISMAAFGPGHPVVNVDIPEGQVLVFAGRGGRGSKEENYKYPKDTAYFLVPTDEYREMGLFGFVIDEARHPRITVPK